MKIKHDFVTNSSSSSFVVAFDKNPTFSYLKNKIMFIEKAHQVWRDCNEQKGEILTPDNEALIEKIISNIAGGYYPGYSENEVTEKEFLYNHDIKLPEGKRLWEIQYLYEQYTSENDRKCYNGGLRVAMEFIKKNIGKYICFFNYGDNGGRFYSEMEHGGTFDNFENIRISNH